MPAQLRGKYTHKETRKIFYAKPAKTERTKQYLLVTFYSIRCNNNNNNNNNNTQLIVKIIIIIIIIIIIVDCNWVVTRWQWLFYM